MGLPHFLIRSDFDYIPLNLQHTKPHNADFIVLSGIDVPRVLKNGYKPVRMLDMADLYTKYNTHRRLRVFANKGLKCAYCQKAGIYLIMGLDNGGGIHVDVYTDTFELMNIDHVIPKSKGGQNTLKNLVPCCCKCNSKKSDNLLSVA